MVKVYDIVQIAFQDYLQVFVPNLEVFNSSYTNYYFQRDINNIHLSIYLVR